jgi:hypothetical protein
MEFKVGDKVRVVDDECFFADEIKNGEIGEITYIINRDQDIDSEYDKEIGILFYIDDRKIMQVDFTNNLHIEKVHCGKCEDSKEKKDFNNFFDDLNDMVDNPPFTFADKVEQPSMDYKKEYERLLVKHNELKDHYKLALEIIEDISYLLNKEPFQF